MRLQFLKLAEFNYKIWNMICSTDANSKYIALNKAARWNWDFKMLHQIYSILGQNSPGFISGHKRKQNFI